MKVWAAVPAAAVCVAVCAALWVGMRNGEAEAVGEATVAAVFEIVDEPGAMPEGDGVAADGSEGDADGGSVDAERTVRVLFGGEVVTMALDDYLAGVVAGEMPASFPAAALEAQAVAARSLVHYRYEHPKHEGAEVCADAGCCMAFGEENEKSRAAVDATDGCVARYEGEAIMAAFFASCDGETRAAEEVWGAAVPYLVSVESGEDEGAKGHGVGMSQHGAAEMARNGAGWREIVGHYYRGVETAPSAAGGG